MSWTLTIPVLGCPARMDPKAHDVFFEHGLRANEIDGSPAQLIVAYIPAYSPCHSALLPAITVGFTLRIRDQGRVRPTGKKPKITRCGCVGKAGMAVEEPSSSRDGTDTQIHQHKMHGIGDSEGEFMLKNRTPLSQWRNGRWHDSSMLCSSPRSAEL